LLYLGQKRGIVEKWRSTKTNEKKGLKESGYKYRQEGEGKGKKASKGEGIPQKIGGRAVNNFET